MREAAVFDEGAKENQQGKNQKSRLPMEQQHDATGQQRGEQQKNEDGHDKFHGGDFIAFAKIRKQSKFIFAPDIFDGQMRIKAKKI